MENSTGNFRFHAGFNSRFLAGSRDLIVYVPPGYDVGKPDDRYPVLYLHDGQNLFDPETAFCHNDWRLGWTLDDLIRVGAVEPLLVVGIYNAGERRIHEYTHVRSRKGVGGGARQHARFVVEELKPFIDSEYRTRTGAVDTGVGGSSLGGLVSLYMGLRFPHIFGKLVVMSPSVWWSSRAILRLAGRPVRKAEAYRGQKIWLDVGTSEGSNPEQCVMDVRALRDALLARGWTLDGDLRYVEDEGAGHNEQAWAARMRDALQFLFPGVREGMPQGTKAAEIPL